MLGSVAAALMLVCKSSTLCRFALSQRSCQELKHAVLDLAQESWFLWLASRKRLIQVRERLRRPSRLLTVRC